MEQPTNQPTVWQLVISHPVCETTMLHTYLNNKCAKWLCSEHEADEQINRTHTHFMLVDYKHSKVALTKEINKYWKGSDNFGILTRWPGNDTSPPAPYDEYILGKYIGKGRENAFSDRGASNGYTTEYLTKLIAGYEGDREITNDSEAVKESSGTVKERVTTKIQYKLKVESPAQQKIRKNDQVANVIKRIREREHQVDRVLETYEIRNIIREMLVEFHEVVGVYKAIDIYDSVMMRMEKYSHRWDKMFDDILEKRKPRL